MTRVDGELKEKQCWKEAAVFFGPPPQSSVGWGGPQHGCKAMGGPQPPRCSTGSGGLRGVSGDTKLRPLTCRIGGWLEQQKQEIIQRVLGSSYQTEIILHYGAFKVNGSLRTLSMKAMVMLWFVRRVIEQKKPL